MTVYLKPDRYRAVVFDLDGVITDTASVHAEAWRQVFNDYLSRLPVRQGERHQPVVRAG